MMVDPPLISVVIPCRNESDYIIPCLESVLNNDYGAEKIELIVCDGMSDDDTGEKLNKFQAAHPGVIVLLNEKRTTQFALNLGVRAARGSIIFILGAHAEMEKNYISTCVHTILVDDSIDCCGGLLHNVSQDKIAEAVALAMSSRFGVGDATFRTGGASGWVDTVAFGAYRKSVFDKIGLFDEELTRNQDDEFNYRLIRSGGKIKLETGTGVNYFVRASWKKLWRQYYQYGYWKVYVNKKHRAVTTLRQTIPFLFVTGLAAGLIGGIFISPMIWMTSGILLVYFFSAGIFAGLKSKSLPQFFRILIAFIILHFGYGIGYAGGIIDFIFLNQKPAAAQGKLSR